MLPPMLTLRRPWPQTLLLTILALLIAAATIMLACGPAAQPIPEEGDTLPAMQPLPADGLNTLPPAQQEGGDTTGESGEEAPTETLPPPPPTYTYPNIRGSSLQLDIVEFEEAQDAASGPSGQSDPAVEDSVIYVEIFLSANTTEVADWLRSKGVSPLYAADGYIDAEVPLSLLGELSQQDGVREVSQPGPVKPGAW